MNMNFAATVAPELGLLGPDEPSPGGLDEQGYTSDGTPRPYMTNPDGTRQYFGQRATGVPGVTPAAPPQTRGPIEGIQGRYDEAAIPWMQQGGDPSTREYWSPEGFIPEPQYPGALGQQPEDPPSVAQQRRTPGMAPQVGIPQGPPQGGLVPEDPPSVAQQRRTPGMAPRVGIPGAPAAPRNMLQEPIRRARIGQPNGRTNPGYDERMANPMDDNGGARPTNTVADLIERLGIRLPSIGPRPAAGADIPLRGRATPPDANQNLATTQESTLDRFWDLGTQQGVDQFNANMSRAARTMGESYSPIGNQGRSRSAQQNLQTIAGGASPDASWHVPDYGGTVRAADLPPRVIGGISGEQNVWRVRQMLQAAGYPWRPEEVDVVWEDGVSQGTGAHYHIEPTPRFNSQRVRTQQ
jgi:hypothetical protein